MIALELDAGGDRFVRGGQVIAEVGDALPIVDCAVVGRDRARVGNAVLGDRQRDVAVVFLQTDEQIGQALRIDLLPGGDRRRLQVTSRPVASTKTGL